MSEDGDHSKWGWRVRQGTRRLNPKTDPGASEIDPDLANAFTNLSDAEIQAYARRDVFSRAPYTHDDNTKRRKPKIEPDSEDIAEASAYEALLRNLRDLLKKKGK